MKLIVFTTWNEPCGIAGYSKNLISGLKGVDENLEVEVRRIEKKFFRSVYSRTHSEYWSELCAGVSAGDVVHIQHEFSFFGDSIIVSNNNLCLILRELRKKGARVVITFHTMPRNLTFTNLFWGFVSNPLASLGGLLELRSWTYVARVIKRERVVCLVHTPHSRAADRKSVV